MLEKDVVRLNERLTWKKLKLGLSIAQSSNQSSDKSRSEIGRLRAKLWTVGHSVGDFAREAKIVDASTLNDLDLSADTLLCF